MQLLLRWTAVYLLCGGAFVALFRENPAALLGDIARSLPGALGFFLSIAWWVVPLFAGMAVIAPRRDMLDRLPRALIAVFACSAFFLVFTMMKTTLPYALPFWADPLFARIDRIVHFGVDPWRIDPCRRARDLA